MKPSLLLCERQPEWIFYCTQQRWGPNNLYRSSAGSVVELFYRPIHLTSNQTILYVKCSENWSTVDSRFEKHRNSFIKNSCCKKGEIRNHLEYLNGGYFNSFIHLFTSVETKTCFIKSSNIKSTLHASSK